MVSNELLEPGFGRKRRCLYGTLSQAKRIEDLEEVDVGFNRRLWSVLRVFCFLQALLQELPENAARMNEWNLPYYILFVGMLLHSISLSVIYKTLREL